MQRICPNPRAFLAVSTLFCCLSLAAGCGFDSAGAQPTRDAAIEADAGVDVGVDTTPADAAMDAAPDAAADVGVDAAEPLGPPYPIVLAHGMFGFEHLADIELVPYWYKIAETLEARGDMVVTTEVDPLNDSATRGAQLVDQIEAYLQDTGYARVNIISHSQGGLDARWAAHHRPDLIASVVTISSPHGGTDIADIVLRLTDHERFRDVVDALIRIVGKPLYDEVGDETSLFKPLRLFSEPGMEEFNKEITDQPGVYYASIAGRSDNHRGGLNCNNGPTPPDFIRRWEYDRDPISAIFWLTEGIVDGGLENRANDGLVRIDQAMWGDFLGCIPADHFDQVGQLLGDHPGGDNKFDYLQFYGDLVDYLRTQGL